MVQKQAAAHGQRQVSTDAQTVDQTQTNVGDVDERAAPIRRYGSAFLLAVAGIYLLFTPLPGIGQLSTILLNHPFYLSLLLVWYVGRTIIAARAHDKQRLQRANGTAPNATPSISILVPAYNEEDTVADTVESIEALEYDGDIETVVVDDGSSDNTWDILQFLSEMYDNLRVFTQENAGSSVARNAALEHARNDVVISLDADTELHPDSIKEIASHFTSDEIVAVGGNVSVSNATEGGWWARTQIHDYACAMELGRMFQCSLGYMLCLSGAFGAFRREKLVEAGGWNDHWLYSDDFEVSVRMQQYGTVRYVPYAIADTEVPTTIREWYKQRMAWAQRGISVMLLHHDKQLNVKMGTVGTIGLPVRALLTTGIIVQVVGYALTISSGSVEAVQSVGWILLVGTTVTTAFCLLMTAALMLFLVNEKPVQYVGWLAVYLTVYRPLHLSARLAGFSQAIWWEIKGFGFSLRSSP